jgi:hypothetical protein
MPVDITLPPVSGDPDGMRSLAASLRADAEGVAVVAAKAASTIDGLEFYGPAADRIDGEVRTSAKGAGQLADRLLAVAATLDRAAAEVEAEQRARERKLDELRRELAPRVAQ